MLHTVIFIGRSGCGKGTQAALFMDYIRARDLDKRQIMYLETGKRFREFVRQDNYSSKLASSLYDADVRQPDFLACWMWGNALIEELDENMHIVFDGVARALDEAQIITTALKFYKREKSTVVHINVSRKWSEERLLSRGRADDRTLTKIDKRLDWFEKDTVPSLDYFRSNPYYNFIEVNGEQAIEDVQRDIVARYEA